MKFKQHDTVQTLVNKYDLTENNTIGAGSIGRVTVTEVPLKDGIWDGVEVKFEHRLYAHYKASELIHAAGNPIREDRPQMQKNDYVQVDDVESVHHNKTGWVEFIDDKINTIAPIMVKFKDENGASTFREDQLKVIGTFNRENRPAGSYEHNGGQITWENYRAVAEWCGAEIVGDPDNPRLMVKTGFGDDPNFKVTVHIGDCIERADGGKFQVWVNPNVRMDEDEPQLIRENRPAELKKFRDQNPLFMATTLVNALHYEGNLPAEDVYIVWFCAALQNWKALVSTNVLDNCYYEVTHNGEKKVTYVDKYVKAEQVTVPSEMLDD